VSGAAYLCDQMVAGGYADWYLPSKDELDQMYLNRQAIGGFANAYYRSSSELDADRAWCHGFSNGFQGFGAKCFIMRVRAVRSF